MSEDREIMGRIRSFTRAEIEAAGGVLKYLDEITEPSGFSDTTRAYFVKPEDEKKTAKPRELAPKQNEKALTITDKGAELYHELSLLGDTPEIKAAKVKLDELVKLAVKAIANS